MKAIHRTVYLADHGADLPLCLNVDYDTYLIDYLTSKATQQGIPSGDRRSRAGANKGSMNGPVREQRHYSEYGSLRRPQPPAKAERRRRYSFKIGDDIRRRDTPSFVSTAESFRGQTGPRLSAESIDSPEQEAFPELKSLLAGFPTSPRAEAPLNTKQDFVAPPENNVSLFYLVIRK
jgi:hypothetical protein